MLRYTIIFIFLCILKFKLLIKISLFAYQAKQSLFYLTQVLLRYKSYIYLFVYSINMSGSGLTLLIYLNTNWLGVKQMNVHIKRKTKPTGHRKGSLDRFISIARCRWSFLPPGTEQMANRNDQWISKLTSSRQTSCYPLWNIPDVSQLI